MVLEQRTEDPREGDWILPWAKFSHET